MNGFSSLVIDIDLVSGAFTTSGGWGDHWNNPVVVVLSADCGGFNVTISALTRLPVRGYSRGGSVYIAPIIMISLSC